MSSGVLCQTQTSYYLVPLILIITLGVIVVLRFCITFNTTITMCLIVWQESYLKYYVYLGLPIVMVNLSFLVCVKFL